MARDERRADVPRRRPELDQDRLEARPAGRPGRARGWRPPSAVAGDQAEVRRAAPGSPATIRASPGVLAEPGEAAGRARLVDRAGDEEQPAALLERPAAAVIRAPLCRPASTTIVASARPLISRFRWGNVPFVGGWSGHSSETTAPPVLDDLAGEALMGAREQPAVPRAEDGDRRLAARRRPRHGRRRRSRPRAPRRRRRPICAMRRPIRAATRRPRSVGRRVPTIATAWSADRAAGSPRTRRTGGGRSIARSRGRIGRIVEGDDRAARWPGGPPAAPSSSAGDRRRSPPRPRSRAGICRPPPAAIRANRAGRTAPAGRGQDRAAGAVRGEERPEPGRPEAVRPTAGPPTPRARRAHRRASVGPAPDGTTVAEPSIAATSARLAGVEPRRRASGTGPPRRGARARPRRSRRGRRSCGRRAGRARCRGRTAPRDRRGRRPGRWPPATGRTPRAAPGPESRPFSRPDRARLDARAPRRSARPRPPTTPGRGRRSAPRAAPGPSSPTGRSGRGAGPLTRPA